MAVTLGATGITYSDGTTQVKAPNSNTDYGRLLSISTYTSGTTYTAPTYCRKVFVKVQGGGGGRR